MAEVFRAGNDLHTATAAGIYGVAVEDVSEEQRQVGKKVNFSIVYGGGMPTLMLQLGIEGGEALALLRNFHRTWPGIGWATKRKPAAEGTLIWYILEELHNPRKKGYITTLYGRHLHPKADHAALNNLDQGCAADLIKWAMVEIEREMRSRRMASHMVLMVHDELIFDVCYEELSFLVEQIPEWMTDPRIEAVVPIKPSCEWSQTTWAEKELYVPGGSGRYDR